MLDFLWVVPALPFLGFLVLGLCGRRLSRPLAGAVGAGSIGLAALAALGVALSFKAAAPADARHVQTLWTWFDVSGLDPSIGFYLDPLSIVMMLVITGVGFLIHLYSIAYMAHDEDFPRFFASMNLFVGAMLVLVLADNLPLLYLGWEGVGLCSYLLIGFWYKDPANGAAARKAFVVTRIGDTAMALGLFLLFSELGTLDIQAAMAAATERFPPGSAIATLAALLLVGGAVGKSAQLPLQTWLPDAMAGPTPVSALIHAATMVTAGVYLIARTHALFELSPSAMAVVAAIGAATLLVAGFSAIAQSDIKRVLAYSTISQLGYMFMALGVGAWSAAVFHLMTHAFFKALLFLGAGAVILSLHHEQDLFKMGGLRKELPLVFWTFLAGSLALAGFPFLTAGFYSKDLILVEAYMAEHGGKWLYAAGLVGAFVTALYSARLVILAFFGEPKTHVHERPKLKITLPLSVLALLSIVGGFVWLPANLGGFDPFARFVGQALPASHAAHPSHELEWTLQLVAAGVFAAGALTAWATWGRRRPAVAPAGALMGFLARGFDFDALYRLLFVRPFVWLSEVNRNDFLDEFPAGLAALARSASEGLRRTQTGRLRGYATGIVVGAVLVVALVVFLWILVALIALPMAAGLLAWALGEARPGLARALCLLALAAQLALGLSLWPGAPAASATHDHGWIEQFSCAWMPGLGIRFELGLDGLGLVLVLLTSFLGILSVAASWTEIKERVGFFHFNLMWILAGITGVFMALDLFLFAFFWEMMLIPMYYLIAIWGYDNRTYAAMKFFIYTQAGGLLMIVSILGLVFLHEAQTGILTFDYRALLGTEIPAGAGTWLMLGFFAAFAVKLPAVPFHNWLPDAHTQAPTAGSVILAGLMLKTGAYGLMRFAVPLFPDASRAFAPVGMLLGAVGIVYGAILAFSQTDFKRLVAYTSVSHLGFVLLGVYAWNELALQGVVMQMVTHGLSTGGLFVLVGILYKRIHTRDLARMGGLWPVAPRMAVVGLILAMASLGLPGLGNFIAEFLVLAGAFFASIELTVVATIGLVFATLYSLRIVQRVFHGPNQAGWSFKDLSARELAILASMIVVLVWLGLFPQPVIELARPAIETLRSDGPGTLYVRLR